MAGIFSDVSTDIQKLRQLKAEIENVKKALKGINVNVDIDIAKGMEAQLKSLTAQYETLVRKVSEAEGKIMISTKRINDASEKIIKAQERLSQSANANPQSDNPVNKTGATSVEAQAKAYDELAREIDGVMGTRAQNIKRMIEEQNAIRLINEEIKKLIKFQTGTSTLTGTQQKRLEQLNNSLLTHKAALAEVRQTLMNNVRLDNAAATSMNGLSQSLSRMRIAYRELTEEERNSPFGKELLASIQLADAKIKELDATIGNHQRNVGNYASTFNGLGMSVQQIVRELPAATMGLNMFFLAISNNLPILTDEIKRAIEMNKQLKAQNQATVPVWKQLISSLFSWQTALVVAITAMSMYGKEIISWIGNLFNAKEEVNALRQEHEALNNAMSNARAESAKEVAQLSVLYAMTQNTNASMQDRIAAVRQLQSQYPAYFGNLSQEAILAGQASAAYQQLTNDIMATAYARAYQNRIEKLAAENVEEIRGSRADFNYMRRNRASYNSARKYLDSERGIYAYSQYQLSQQNRDNVQIDYGAVAEYTQQLKIATEYEERRVRWQRHNTAYKQREVQMQEYENEVLKRQSALMKTTQGSLYTEDAKKAEREVERREKGYEKLSKESKTAQEELNKDLLSLQQQNQDDEIALLQDGTQKKLAEIKNDYQKRIAEINKQEAEFKAKNKEAGLTNIDLNGLTKEQKEALQEARNNAAKEQEQQTNEIYLADVQAMRDYLKKYGTFQQQKLAIAEEYAEKIKHAQNEGERLTLVRERDKAISDVNLSAIKQNIDWAGVFGNLGTMFREEMERSLESLRIYMRSDEFKSMEPENQAKIVEAVNNLKGNISGDLTDVDFKKIGELTIELQNAQRKMITAYSAEVVAYDNLKKAQENYRNAMESGTAEQKAAAKANLDAAQTVADNMSQAYKQAVGEFNATGNNLKEATDCAVDAINSISSAISQIRSNSLSGAYEGTQQLTETLGKSLSGFEGLLGKTGNALSRFSSSLGGATGEIVSAALGLLDLLKDGFGSIFADLSDLMFNAVNGILDDLLSGGIITKPLQSVVDGVSNILNTITFGGFNSWLGGNDKDVMEAVNRLTDSNKYLQESIDRLSERIGDESNTADQTLGYYITAKDAEEQWRENQQKIIKNLASAWTNTGYGFLGLGGKGSFNGHAPDSNWSGWDSFSETLKNYGFDVTLRNSEDFWELTPEQMELLRDNNPKEWQKLFDSDGHKNPIDAVDEYIEHAGKLEELTDVLNENLTKISFDSLYDNFIDTLMDMDASAEDFADNMSEYFMRAALSEKVGALFKTRLNNWYNDFASAMEDGTLDDNEIDALRNDYENIVKDAMAERDDLANIIGYTGSSKEQQSATAKGFETMSQDTAEELNGRFTSVYESNLRIETAEQQQTVAITELRGSISALTAQASGMYNIADETRTILANSYLELQQIRENTGEIIKPIKQMQADMAEVKRNTSRL